MLVKGVEESEAELKIRPLPYLGVLGYRKVQVLAAGTSQV